MSINWGTNKEFIFGLLFLIFGAISFVMLGKGLLLGSPDTLLMLLGSFLVGIWSGRASKSAGHTMKRGNK